MTSTNIGIIGTASQQQYLGPFLAGPGTFLAISASSRGGAATGGVGADGTGENVAGDP